MEVEFALLAAHAELAPDGRLSVLSGGLDTIRGFFPGITVYPVYFAARIVFLPDEGDKDYKVSVELLLPDGTVFEKSDQNFRPEVGPKRTKVGFIITFFNMNIQTLGDYMIRLLIDGHEKKTLPLSFEALPQSTRTDG